MSYMDRLRPELAERAEPVDFWDRPRGDWGGHPPTRPGQCGSRRSTANDAYRRGSRALTRREDGLAQALFTLAVAEQHPGAAFRLLIPVLRAMVTGSGPQRGLRAVTRYLNRSAAWGHADAGHLLRQLATHAASPTALAHTLAADCYEPQDRDGYSEVRRLLCQFLTSQPRPAPADRAASRPAGADPAGRVPSPTSRQAHLVGTCAPTPQSTNTSGPDRQLFRGQGGTRGRRPPGGQAPRTPPAVVQRPDDLVDALADRAAGGGPEAAPLAQNAGRAAVGCLELARQRLEGQVGAVVDDQGQAGDQMCVDRLGSMTPRLSDHLQDPLQRGPGRGPER